jgi:hypothetical protein
MNKESEQPSKESKKFKLGPLGSLNQVTKGLAKGSVRWRMGLLTVRSVPVSAMAWA